MAHHRQHAIQHLRDCASHVHGAQFKFSDFIDVSTNPNLSLGNSTAPFLNHLANVSKDLVDLVALLGDETADLDVIRRRISQPKLDTPTDPQPTSTLRDMRLAIYILQNISINEVNEAEDKLAMITRTLSAGWGFLDMAEWHIIDAIREEKYSDPAFQEGA